MEGYQKTRAQFLKPATTKRNDGGLYEFVPTLARGNVAPRHLDPLVKLFERSWTEPVRGTAHAPPRHAKTETCLAFLAQTLLKFPHKRCGYLTYEATLARSKARKVRSWVVERGLQLQPAGNRLEHWETTQGGGLVAGGVGGALTGKGLDLLIVDDPYKNRQQAESPAYRQNLLDWWADVAETRLEPGGSVFVFHTRWTPDDLIAWVHANDPAKRWSPHISMPAVNDDGTTLWPERWPIEELRPKMANAYTWASLYQGEPRPRGGAVFEGTPSFASAIPPNLRIVIGFDFAYTTKKTSDFSVAVALGQDPEGRIYVLDVLRRQARITDFLNEAAEFCAKWPHAPRVAYIGGTETATIDFFAMADFPITGMRAKADKFQRAQPVAAAWNSHKIHLPNEAPWADDFLAEVLGFTGVKDPHDDQVDALAGAFDALSYEEDTEIYTW